MSCIISLGGQPEECWMVKNSIYAWFVRIVVSQCEEEIARPLMMSARTNGLVLNALHRNDAELAYRLAGVLREEALAIAAGRYHFVDPLGVSPETPQEAIAPAFGKLASLLEGWLQAHRAVQPDQDG